MNYKSLSLDSALSRICSKMGGDSFRNSFPKNEIAVIIFWSVFVHKMKVSGVQNYIGPN